MMAKRILVPLDQTVEAESVLPLVGDMARGGSATLRLLHVAPPPHNVLDQDGHVVAYADQEMARLEAEGLDYLRTVEARLDGATVECTVRFGEAVDQILEEAEVFGADLITLTTGHNRRGLKGLILGTTATQVCRRTDLPVMVLRPGNGA
jgi:nucleotide-binding universal stress UspA family protein